jgi:hypothetical protein
MGFVINYDDGCCCGNPPPPPPPPPGPFPIIIPCDNQLCTGCAATSKCNGLKSANIVLMTIAGLANFDPQDCTSDCLLNLGTYQLRQFKGICGWAGGEVLQCNDAFHPATGFFLWYNGGVENGLDECVNGWIQDIVPFGYWVLAFNDISAGQTPVETYKLVWLISDDDWQCGQCNTFTPADLFIDSGSRCDWTNAFITVCPAFFCANISTSSESSSSSSSESSSGSQSQSQSASQSGSGSTSRAWYCMEQGSSSSSSSAAGGGCALPITTPCCPGGLPETLTGTFAKVFGSCNCIDGLMVTFTYNGVDSWISSFNACGGSIVVTIQCVSGTFNGSGTCNGTAFLFGSAPLAGFTCCPTPDLTFQFAVGFVSACSACGFDGEINLTLTE